MKITIIGTGNVAFHLAKRLLEKKWVVNQVIGRNAAAVADFATIFQTDGTTDFAQLKPDSDIFIIAVNDDAIATVAHSAQPFIDSQLVVHTSGTVSSEILRPFFKNFGGLYPLQTFTRARAVDFDQVPIFISHEAPPQYLSEKNALLESLARQISPNVYFLPDDKRVALHVAAVFVNNFTNHLFSVGHSLAAQNGFPFETLLPLISETIEKIKHHPPDGVQTGPARRGDVATIERHKAFLAETEFLDIYTLLTKKINPKIS